MHPLPFKGVNIRHHEAYAFKAMKKVHDRFSIMQLMFPGDKTAQSISGDLCNLEIELHIIAGHMTSDQSGVPESVH